MTHGRLDNNHIAIVAGLRACGCSVQSLADVGKGCPDLLVSHAGHHFLLEVKGPQGKLTPDQVTWIQRCHGVVFVVHSTEEALEALHLVGKA